MSELLHGVHRATGATRARRAAFVERLLSRYVAMPVTGEVARVHAQAWAELEERGSMIGPHDLWIAATALANGLGVVTHNARDLARVPGLRVVTP